MFLFRFLGSLVTAPIRLLFKVVYSLVMGVVKIALLIMLGLFALEYGAETVQATFQTQLESGIKKIESCATEFGERIPELIERSLPAKTARDSQDGQSQR